MQLKRTSDRRRLLIGAGALACAGMLAGRTARAEGEAAPAPAASPVPAEAPKAEHFEASAQFKEALKQLIGEATPLEERVTVDIPDEVENGNIVPYRLEVESPMDEQDSIKRLHLLSTANPQAQVATFHFSPLSAQAAVTGRMRLAKSQEVVAVAETVTGAFLVGRRTVHVDIAGCGNE